MRGTWMKDRRDAPTPRCVQKRVKDGAGIREGRNRGNMSGRYDGACVMCV